MKLTKDEINRVYDEIERRTSKDIKDGTLQELGIFEHRQQGMFAALMALSDNWADVVFMIDEIERERGYRVDPPEVEVM